MKIPSLFKTPRYQKFNIVPRHYDPVKDEIEVRTSRIRSQLAADKDLRSEVGYQESRISGAFGSRKPRRMAVNMTQTVILMLMVGVLVGYWYYGNIALYVFLVVSSVLLYLKIKRIL